MIITIFSLGMWDSILFVFTKTPYPDGINNFVQFKMQKRSPTGTGTVNQLTALQCIRPIPQDIRLQMTKQILLQHILQMKVSPTKDSRFFGSTSTVYTRSTTAMGTLIVASEPLLLSNENLLNQFFQNSVLSPLSANNNHHLFLSGHGEKGTHNLFFDLKWLKGLMNGGKINRNELDTINNFDKLVGTNTPAGLATPMCGGLMDIGHGVSVQNLAEIVLRLFGVEPIDVGAAGNPAAGGAAAEGGVVVGRDAAAAAAQTEAPPPSLLRALALSSNPDEIIYRISLLCCNGARRDSGKKSLGYMLAKLVAEKLVKNNQTHGIVIVSAWRQPISTISDITSVAADMFRTGFGPPCLADIATSESSSIGIYYSSARAVEHIFCVELNPMIASLQCREFVWCSHAITDIIEIKNELVSAEWQQVESNLLDIFCNQYRLHTMGDPTAAGSGGAASAASAASAAGAAGAADSGGGGLVGGEATGRSYPLGGSMVKAARTAINLPHALRATLNIPLESSQTPRSSNPEQTPGVPDPDISSSDSVKMPIPNFSSLGGITGISSLASYMSFIFNRFCNTDLHVKEEPTRQKLSASQELLMLFGSIQNSLPTSPRFLSEVVISSAAIAYKFLSSYLTPSEQIVSRWLRELPLPSAHMLQEIRDKIIAIGGASITPVGDKQPTWRGYSFGSTDSVAANARGIQLGKLLLAHDGPKFSLDDGAKILMWLSLIGHWSGSDDHSGRGWFTTRGVLMSRRVLPHIDDPINSRKFQKPLSDAERKLMGDYNKCLNALSSTMQARVDFINSKFAQIHSIMGAYTKILQNIGALILIYDCLESWYGDMSACNVHVVSKIAAIVICAIEFSETPAALISQAFPLIKLPQEDQSSLRLFNYYLNKCRGCNTVDGKVKLWIDFVKDIDSDGTQSVITGDGMGEAHMVIRTALHSRVFVAPSSEL